MTALKAAPTSRPAPVVPAGPPRLPTSSRRSRRSKRKDVDQESARSILESVGHLLDADQFRYQAREDGSALDAAFIGRSGTFHLAIYARESPSLLGLQVGIPLIVPEDRRVAMAETVTRANYGLSLGCFQLDMRDGELTFRAVMPLGPTGTVEPEQFRHLLGASMWTVDRYHRAFCRLLFADDLSPAEVIAEVEMKPENEP